MKIVLIRHTAPLVESGICYGRLDVPLQQTASQEFQRLSGDRALRGVAHVWTSPTSRCHRLACAIAQSTGSWLTADPRLRELDFGAWEGEPWNSISRAALDAWAASPLLFAPPGGESGAALIARVHDFLDHLLSDWRDCVVVSHGGPLKVLHAALEGREVNLFAPPPPFGSVTIVSLPRRAENSAVEHAKPHPCGTIAAAPATE